MSSAKRLETWGALGIVEASYLAGGAPAATDGIFLLEPPDIESEYLHDGARGRNPGGGQMPRVAQSGLGYSADLMTQVYTPGAAYSAAVKPSLDALLRAAGFTATGVFTAGIESYTYTPAVGSLESLALELYVRSQKYALAGTYAGLKIASENLGIPTWTFSVRGVGTRPVDLAVPSITYPHVATQKPAKSVNVALSILGTTGHVLRSFEFDLGREFTPRADENSISGHQGFTPSPRSPTLRLVVEAPALSVQDFYQAREEGTEGVVSLRHGAAGAPGQYKRWTLTLGHAQIISVDDTDDGPSAMVELEIAAGVTPGSVLQDDVTFLFD